MFVTKVTLEIQVSVTNESRIKLKLITQKATELSQLFALSLADNFGELPTMENVTYYYSEVLLVEL